MGRHRAFYTGFKNGRYLSGLLQDKLEKASGDHFPLIAIFSYKKMERAIDQINLSIFPTSLTPLLPVGGDVLLDKKMNFLSRTPVAISENTREKLSDQADCQSVGEIQRNTKSYCSACSFET